MTAIYVGNLDFTASEGQLRTLFAGLRSNGDYYDRHGSVHGGRSLMVNETRLKLHSNRERESFAKRDHQRHRVWR